MLFLYEFLIDNHDVPKWTTRLCVLTVGQLIILPFNLLTYCDGKASVSVVRAMGPCFYAGIIMMLFLVWAARHAGAQGTAYADHSDERDYHDGSTLDPAAPMIHREHSVTSLWSPRRAFAAATALLGAVFCIFLFCQVWLLVLCRGSERDWCSGSHSCSSKLMCSQRSVWH